MLMLCMNYSGFSKSQNEDKDVIDILSDDFESAFDDIGFIVNDLVDFNSTSALRLGGVVVGTAAVSQYEPL